MQVGSGPQRWQKCLSVDFVEITADNRLITSSDTS